MPERTPFAIGRDGILIATGRKAKDTRKLGFCLHRMNYTKLTRCQGKPAHSECETVRLMALSTNPVSGLRKRKLNILNHKPRTSDHKAIMTQHAQVRKDGITPDMRTAFTLPSNAESVKVSKYAAAVRMTAEELGIGLANPDAVTDK